MGALSLQDRDWSRFDVTTSDTIGSNIDRLDVFRHLLRALHGADPITRFTFNQGVVIIRFVDGRLWRVALTAQTVDAPVYYQLVPQHQWRRSVVAGYITPLTDALVQLYSLTTINTIDAIPV